MARQIGLITLFFLVCLPSFAQTSEFPIAIKAGGGMLSYFAHPGDPPLTNSSFHPTIELGVSKYLAGGFDFRSQLTFAPNVNYPIGEQLFQTGPLFDMNYLLAFKFNNGVFFRESAFIGPYLMFGVGGSYVKNHPDAYLPLGGGVQFRVNPRMSFRVETVKKISVNKNVQNLAHALAFVYNLGSPSEIPPGTIPKEIEEELVAANLMPRDSDWDGIVDHEDDCPNHPGFIQFMGCPTADQEEDEVYALDQTSLSTTDAEMASAPDPESMSQDESMSFETLSSLVELGDSPDVGAQLNNTNPPAVESEPIAESSASFDLAEAITEASESDTYLPDEPEPESQEVIAESTSVALAPVQAAPVEVAPQPEPAPMAEPVIASTQKMSSPCSSEQLPSTKDSPIFFAYGSHELKGEAKGKLKELADVLNSCEELQLVLEGHTDDVGTENDNLVLSIMRAFNVKYYLVYEYGISQSRISSRGLGEMNAYATNSHNKEKNRRVDYTFVF
ncbi:MAG: OmpA family protein [Bacteroidota bacterium]